MRFFVSLAFLVWIMPSPTADACSAPVCWPGSFVPRDGATVPANLPALYWRPTRDNSGTSTPDPTKVRLTREDAPGTAIAFTATAVENGDFVLVPDAPLAEGVRYVLEDTNTCGDAPGPRIAFTTGPNAPLPASLGAVQIIGHGTRLDLEVATASGSCSTPVDAVTLSLEVAPSSDAAPWMELLHFETVVDDQPWSIMASIRDTLAPGASWQGRGRDLVFRTCTPNDDALHAGVGPGGHEVAFRATLPGTQIALATPAQAIELICDARPGDDNDDDGDGGGCTTTPAASWLALLAVARLVRRRRR